jgi:glutathione S-transferase
MKLYHQPGTRSSRVRWLLGELGLDHDVEQVNVFVGEGRKPEYQKIHPHGFVPALEDDGMVLIESAAICMYLVDRYGNGRFAPAFGTKERGKYYEWMVYVPATADPICETVMFHTVFLPETHRLSPLVERSKKRWSKLIEPRYREALSRSKYVLGDELSAADIMVANSLAWAKIAGMLSDDPTLNRYLAEMEARPAYVASLKA